MPLSETRLEDRPQRRPACISGLDPRSLRYAQDLARSCRESAELERACFATVYRLARIALEREAEDEGHLLRVAWYSRCLGEFLGLPGPEIEAIAGAAPLHDVGKIGVSQELLRQPGSLSPAEWSAVQGHAEIGGRLLQGLGAPLLELASKIAWCHHERWDGSGYPRGLRDEGIPIAARIVNLADCYDALRSARPYKPALSRHRTRRILLEGDHRLSPCHFDPELLAAFERVEPQLSRLYETYRERRWTATTSRYSLPRATRPRTRGEESPPAAAAPRETDDDRTALDSRSLSPVRAGYSDEESQANACPPGRRLAIEALKQIATVETEP